MTRFTLAVLPDGRAILTTNNELTVAQRQDLTDAVRGWREGRWPVLVIESCETVQVAEVDFDLDPHTRFAERSPAEIRHERLIEGSLADAAWDVAHPTVRGTAR